MRFPFRKPLAGLLSLIAVGAGLAVGQGSALAFNKYLEIPPPNQAEHSPAFSYANLSNADAFAELGQRGISYRREPNSVPGVRAPIRLTGPLRGVSIHSVLPEEERKQTAFEILDARLALALDDFCQILQAHDIVEVVHFTMYRPAGKTPAEPGQPQSRHPGGLAIDLGAMRKRDGEWLAIGPHWSSSLGSKTCGADGRKLKPRRGREIISILCEAADQRIFHYMLTPHFDKAHSDHLHLEIKPDVRWFLVN